MAMPVILSRRAEVAARVVLGTGFAAFLTDAGLYFHFGNVLPTRPNPATGNIYSLNNHGHIVYMNSHQDDLFNTVRAVAFSCIVVLGLLVLAAKLRERADAKS